MRVVTDKARAAFDDFNESMRRFNETMQQTGHAWADLMAEYQRRKRARPWKVSRYGRGARR